MELTAWGGETRDNIIQLIPFTASLSLTLYWVISINLHITFYWEGGTQMNQLDRRVYKCASVDTCNECVTLFFLRISYISTFTVTIFTCAVQDTNLCSIFLNLSSWAQFPSIWCQWTVWVRFIIVKVRPCWKESKPFKSMYFDWLFFVPNAVWYIMFFLSCHLMLHAELGPYHSFTVVVSKHNTFNTNNSIK